MAKNKVIETKGTTRIALKQTTTSTKRTTTETRESTIGEIEKQGYKNLLGRQIVSLAVTTVENEKLKQLSKIKL